MISNLKNYTFNIVIPAINIDKLLINCVKFCLLQSYKNYVINVVVDNDNNSNKLYNLPNVDDIPIIVSTVKKLNISTKRNIGASKSKCKYLAFIDSDAYPQNNWLETSYQYFKKNDLIVVGGPSGIPFPNEKFIPELTNIAKKSFFCTGTLAFRKYSKNNKFCEWVESCNFIIEKDKYDEIKGMNDDVYIGEDLELCTRINKKYGNNKILFAGNVIIFHKDRNLINFLKQRFVYGLSINIALKNTRSTNKFIQLLPFLSFLFSLLLVSSIFLNVIFLYLTLLVFLLSFIFIIYDLRKFKINFIKKVLSTVVIYLANLSYVIGNLLCFIKIGKYLTKNIYMSSK